MEQEGNSPQEIGRVEKWINDDVKEASAKMVRVSLAGDGEETEVVYGKFLSIDSNKHIISVEEFVESKGGMYEKSGRTIEIDMSKKKVKSMSLRGGSGIFP